MSAVIEKFIVCDECGETFGVDSREQTITQTRQDAHEDGWITRGSKDYCEDCKKRREK